MHNAAAIQTVDNGGGKNGESVGAVSIIEQRHADAIFLENQWMVAGKVGAVAKSACAQHAQAVKYFRCSNYTIFPAVAAMVVGCNQHIKSGFTQGHCQFVGSAELRVTGKWFSGKGEFKIGYGKILLLMMGAI